MCSKGATAKEFYLTIVRHGQTIANIHKTVQGHSDTPLSELGLGQAKALARYFHASGTKPFNRVYSSDLSRARETCHIILSGFDGPTNESAPVGIETDERLRERKYGPYEGKSISHLQQEALSKGYNLSNFTQYTPDGVESAEQVRARVSEFCYRKLLKDAQNDEEILIVSHWATILQFLKILQPISGNSIRDEHLIEAPNTALSRFKIRCQLSRETVDEVWTIDGLQVFYLHQTPHLQADQRSANLKQQLA